MNWSWSHSRLAPGEDLRSTAANDEGFLPARSYTISFTAATMCRAEIPRASINSSGFPE